MTCVGKMSCPISDSSISVDWDEMAQQTYTESSPCTFIRKLCVTCEDIDGETYVRVQTNSLPNHCMNGLLSGATASDADFTVKYNPSVDMSVLNYTSNDINSVEKTSAP